MTGDVWCSLLTRLSCTRCQIVPHFPLLLALLISHCVQRENHLLLSRRKFRSLSFPSVLMGVIGPLIWLYFCSFIVKFACYQLPVNKMQFEELYNWTRNPASVWFTCFNLCWLFGSNVKHLVIKEFVCCVCMYVCECNFCWRIHFIYVATVCRFNAPLSCGCHAAFTESLLR